MLRKSLKSKTRT